MRLALYLVGAMLGAAGAVAAPIALVVFTPGNEPDLKLRPGAPILYDRAGAKRFVAQPGYLLKLAGPKPKVRAWDPVRSLVRVSPRGADELWLACEAVEVEAPACQPLEFSLGLEGELRIVRRPVARAGAAPSRAVRGPLQEHARGLPQCPGDPRCPR